MQVICPEAKGCKYECDHKKPHSHHEFKGCNNLRCGRAGVRLSAKESYEVGQGKVPPIPVSYKCVEVK